MKLNKLLIIAAAVSSSAMAQDKVGNSSDFKVYATQAKEIAQELYKDNKVVIEDVGEKAKVLAGYAFYQSLWLDLQAAKHLRSLEWTGSNQDIAIKGAGTAALSAVTIANAVNLYKLYRVPMNTIISPYTSARESIASIRNLSQKIGLKDTELQGKLLHVDKYMMDSDPVRRQAPTGVKNIRQEVEAMKTERTKTALKLPFKAVIAPFKVLANGGISLAVNGGMLYMIGYEGLLQGQIRLSNEELDQRIELIGQESDKYRDAIVKWVR